MAVTISHVLYDAPKWGERTEKTIFHAFSNAPEWKCKEWIEKTILHAFSKDKNKYILYIIQCTRVEM